MSDPFFGNYRLSRGFNYLPGKNQRLQEPAARISEIPDIVPKLCRMPIYDINGEPRLKIHRWIHAVDYAFDCFAKWVTQVECRRANVGHCVPNTGNHGTSEKRTASYIGS